MPTLSRYLHQLLAIEPRFALRGPGPESWAMRRDRLVARVRDLVGERGEPGLRSTERIDAHGLRYEMLAFRTADDLDVRAAFVAPRGPGPHPAVLVCPGRNARLEQVVGIETPDHPDRNVAERLARRGVAALVLDYGLRGEIEPERRGTRDEFNLLGLSLGLREESLAAILARNAIGLLHYLRGREDVDRWRCALFGHSLGGTVALHAALCVPERLPLAVAAMCGHYPEIFAQRLEASAAHALPGILRWGDVPDLLAALAPAPLLLLHGTADRILPVDDARVVMEEVRRAYAVLGAGAEVHAVVHEGGHGTDLETLWAFLDERWREPLAPPAPCVPAARVVFDRASRARILADIDQCLSTGVLTLGERTRTFERAAARWTEAADAVALASGTAAVEACLRRVEVAGATVLIPAVTFFATAEAALHAGARVDFVDIEVEGLGMCPRHLEQKLRDHPDVAAVVVVHLGGIVPPSLRAVLAMCHARGIPVIEDAAHALGSRLDGKAAGSFGRMAAFSMYPTKVATSGEGGFVAVHDEGDADALRLLRDHGKRSFHENSHAHLGNNWRMSELHAAVGIADLDRLEAALRERTEAAATYDRLLVEVPRLRPLPLPAGSTGNGYKYVALLDDDVRRDELKATLRTEHGVSLAGEIYSAPCCAQPYFAGQWRAEDHPVAHRFCDRHVCLPLYPTLTKGEQSHVVSALKQVLAR